MTEPDFRPPSQQVRSKQQPAGYSAALGMVGILLVAAGVGWYVWGARSSNLQDPAGLPAFVPPTQQAVQLPQAATDVEVAASTASVEPLHPLSAHDAARDQISSARELEMRVRQWLEQTSTLQYVVWEGLAYHIVATIDNLPRGHAAPRLWPLSPVGGRMSTAQAPDGQLYIATDNTTRYDGLVGFIRALDMQAAAQLYQQAYPVFQHAYEELGYPGKYFNDRLVEVIDHLLQTPQMTQPLALRLVEVQGTVSVEQPWLRYEFADTQWQNLSAGQKILLRIGPAHAASIQSQLRALRSHIAQAAH